MLRRYANEYGWGPGWDTIRAVIDIDKRLDVIERSLREYFEQAPVGEFAARKAALDTLNEE